MFSSHQQILDARCIEGNHVPSFPQPSSHSLVTAAPANEELLYFQDKGIEQEAIDRDSWFYRFYWCFRKSRLLVGLPSSSCLSCSLTLASGKTHHALQVAQRFMTPKQTSSVFAGDVKPGTIFPAFQISFDRLGSILLPCKSSWTTLLLALMTAHLPKLWLFPSKEDNELEAL